MKTSPWFVKFEPRPSAAVRVFCCPFAGGGASWFSEWSRGLDPLLELVAVQLPGRENRILETPCDSMRAIVTALTNEAPRLLDRPYVIYGHSMGGSIGFELVRALVARGFPPPLHFIASGSPAPHLPRRRPPISQLPDDQFLQEIRKYGGMPEQILDNRELLELYLPMIRADFKVVEQYRSNLPANLARLPVPASIHGGTSDATVEASDLSAWHNVADVVNLRMHSGGHFFIKEHYGHILSEITAIARTRGMQPRDTRQRKLLM
jgi:medium-chain acyl-[acyl-carrier-protein] hydrolase